MLQLIHHPVAQVGGGVGHRAHHAVQVLTLQVRTGKAVAKPQEETQYQNRDGNVGDAAQQQKQNQHRQGGNGLALAPDLQLVVNQPAAQGVEEPFRPLLIGVGRFAGPLLPFLAAGRQRNGGRIGGRGRGRRLALGGVVGVFLARDGPLLLKVDERVQHVATAVFQGLLGLGIGDIGFFLQAFRHFQCNFHK